MDKFKKFIDDFDFADWRCISLLAVLFILPSIMLFYLYESSASRKLMDSRIKNDSSVMMNSFNFGKMRSMGKKTRNNTGFSSGVSAPRPAVTPKNYYAPENKVSGYESMYANETPEEKVERELQKAMTSVEESQKHFTFPPGTPEKVKRAYEAEHNLYLCNGKGAMERGDLISAEKFFKQALKEAEGNLFLKAYALGELCGLYEKTKNLAALEEAFKEFMDVSSKLPMDMGGGPLLAISAKNAFVALRTLKNSSKMPKVQEALGKIPEAADLNIKPEDFDRSIDDAIGNFPVKLGSGEGYIRMEGLH